MRRVSMICNPTAGGRHDWFGAVQARLHELGCEIDVFPANVPAMLSGSSRRFPHRILM
jgi:hypothetical protein